MSNLTAVFTDEQGRTVLTARGSAHHRRHLREHRDAPPPKKTRRRKGEEEVAADERVSDAVPGAAAPGDEGGVAGREA